MIYTPLWFQKSTDLNEFGSSVVVLTEVAAVLRVGPDLRIVLKGNHHPIQIEFPSAEQAEREYDRLREAIGMIKL